MRLPLRRSRHGRRLTSLASVVLLSFWLRSSRVCLLWRRPESLLLKLHIRHAPGAFYRQEAAFEGVVPALQLAPGVVNRGKGFEAIG